MKTKIKKEIDEINNAAVKEINYYKRLLDDVDTNLINLLNNNISETKKIKWNNWCEYENLNKKEIDKLNLLDYYYKIRNDVLNLIYIINNQKNKYERIKK